MHLLIKDARINHHVFFTCNNNKATNLDCGVCGPNSRLYYELLVMSLEQHGLVKKNIDFGMNTKNC
jgi:hypothetical protein